jgi:hypothetical protein
MSMRMYRRRNRRIEIRTLSKISINLKIHPQKISKYLIQNKSMSKIHLQRRIALMIDKSTLKLSPKNRRRKV